MRTALQRTAVFTLGAAVFGLSAVGASANSGPTGIEMRAPSVFRSVANVVSIADDEAAVPAGTIDDGANRLPEAAITVDEAIAAAQGVASGPIGEIDLEDYHGALVFNVDVGNSDVKVDAATGEVIGSETDD